MLLETKVPPFTRVLLTPLLTGKCGGGAVKQGSSSRMKKNFYSEPMRKNSTKQLHSLHPTPKQIVYGKGMFTFQRMRVATGKRRGEGVIQKILKFGYVCEVDKD
jgi:hypothetical protein